MTPAEKAVSEYAFGCAFRVAEDGSVTSAYPDVHGPESVWDEECPDGWAFFSSGYTGQYGYRGPVMHSSEQLSGRLLTDILATPGVYVVIPVEWSPTEDTEDGEDTAEGWIVLRMDDCSYVVDGTDTDGTVWHRCLAHDDLAPSPDAPCSKAR